ncbi:MAG: DUF5050 domain-containing protein [Lachnospiraceae bacterium]|nr:DUF5050 domain-containing protein [Lachnospiraceae bacterium]
MNPQYHPAYGGASATQNMPYGVNAPYEQTAPYGMNQPYGQNAQYGPNPTAPYGMSPNAPYGMNQPYEQAAPYGMNQPPYGQNAPYGMNQPYGQNAPYGMNQPYEQNAPYGMNQPYEQNISYGVNSNPTYGMNQPPYGQNAQYGANPTTPHGMNPNPTYGMNQPYGQNPPYGVNPPYEIAPVYGANLPCEVNPPFGGAASHGLPAVYTPTWQQGVIEPYQGPYRFMPNNPKHTEGGAKEGINQLLWFSIAGIMIAAFLAIMIGIAIHDDGTGMNVSEAFSSWIAGFSTKEEGGEENLPAVSFVTESSETIRGDLFAVGEDGSVFVRTEYGVCRVAKNGNGYEYNGWAAELAPDVTIRSMAVYGDYLYLACGENGIYRVNTARSNTLTQIIDDNVWSFAIAENNLFYISMDHAGPGYGDSWGKLYITGLNGKGQRALNEKVLCSSKYFSSADFIYVDGYLYYFDQDENLKRMRADGTGSRVVVERERQKPSFSGCGLYENGGILYLPSQNGGIYSYDIETDKLKKVTDVTISPHSPILFVGNALLYKNETECAWHQIKDGQDHVLESTYNDAELWMQAVGTGELLAFHEPNDHYAISFWGGNIHSEDLVEIEYETMPEVDIEEEQTFLFQGTVQEDCRAARFVYAGPNEASVYEHYVIFMDARYDYSISGGPIGPLFWTYVDEDGEHTELLVEGEVGTFFVENDVLYYTLWDGESESYALFYQCLADHEEEPEGCLIAEGMKKDFACYNGMIYYVTEDDGKLYRYILWSRESEQISEDKVGCYDIYNGMIYYENLTDATICKMRLDGTQAEEIDAPFDCGEPLWQLKVCPYDGSIYVAVTMDREGTYRGNSMCLFSEDGQMELFFAEEEDFGNFDRKQTLYYRDGLLYYSSSIAYEVRVFDFEEYFDGGGSGIRADSYDTLFCSENMNAFAVTDEFVYVQLYLDQGIIEVFDRETGKLVEEIDCSDFGRYMN